MATYSDPYLIFKYFDSTINPIILTRATSEDLDVFLTYFPRSDGAAVDGIATFEDGTPGRYSEVREYGNRDIVDQPYGHITLYLGAQDGNSHVNWTDGWWGYTKITTNQVSNGIYPTEGRIVFVDSTPPYPRVIGGVQSKYTTYKNSVNIKIPVYSYNNGDFYETEISANIPYGTSNTISYSWDNINETLIPDYFIIERYNINYIYNVGPAPWNTMATETSPIDSPPPTMPDVPVMMVAPTPTMMDPEPIPPSSNPVTMEQMMAEMIPSPNTPVDDTGGTDVLTPVQSMSDVPPAINPTPTPPEDVLIPVRTSNQDFAVSAGSASTVTLAYRYIIGTLGDPLRRPPPVVYR